MQVFDGNRPSVHTANAMVATSQPLASLVGIEILKNGGNAVDAAIAIAAMLNVLEPMMAGIGGDVFAMVYWHKNKSIQGLNASGIQPRKLDLNYYKTRNLKTIPQAGFESINIPGAFDGWIALHEKYGSKPFDKLLNPAINCAEEGFAVGEKTAKLWAYGATKLALFLDSAKAYLIDGCSPKAGQIFRQRELAATLKLLSKGGREAFYEGPIAKQLVAYCPLLELADFKAQKSEWVEPISAKYRGYEIYEIPPNGQGLVVLQTLRILEGFALGKMNEIDYEHHIIEALKLAFADGHRYIADPHFFNTPVEELLSDCYIEQRRTKILPDQSNFITYPGKIHGDTTYFTVVDQDRNAVSFIMSISDLFGSGIVPRGTGIVMNNRGCELSLDPDQPNAAAPYKRPYHSIIPAMVFKDKHPFMTFGCMGGNMQPQGQIQIISNLLDRNMTLQQALSAPRIRILGENTVALEETFSPELIQGLIKLGHKRISGDLIPANWSLPHSFAQSFKGSAQAIVFDREYGTLVGASDSRLDGIPIGY
jgi:gamma-glutamyltranspeptidase / glutathione hydrolase